MIKVIELDELAAQVFVAYCANPSMVTPNTNDKHIAHWAFNSAQAFIDERRRLNNDPLPDSKPETQNKQEVCHKEAE